MMPKKNRFLFVMMLVFVAASAWPVGASRRIALQYLPQEGLDTTIPDFEQKFLDRSIEIRVHDGRRVDDAAVVGQGTDDDDRKFRIRTSNDVIPYLRETMTGIAEDWGLKTATPADRVLSITVTQFFVAESNKALGSMYQSDVRLEYVLKDAQGRAIDEGTASGDAIRWGRSASSENYNEVLSDALQDAFETVLSSGIEQETRSRDSDWFPNGSSNASAENRLRQLEDLRRKELITKAEYDRKRAEILKDL